VCSVELCWYISASVYSYIWHGTEGKIYVYLLLEDVSFSNTDSIRSCLFLLCMVVNFCNHVHILCYISFNLDPDIPQTLILQQLDKAYYNAF
jgi:hypothetical protein